MSILTAVVLTATISVAPVTEPLEPPVALVTVQETGILLYQKLDPTAPASWPNSGLQSFIVAVPGHSWFTSYPGSLPEGVCGPGWAVQQDQIEHDGSFSWPATIEYPNNVLSQLGVLVSAKHQNLESLVTVPDCIKGEEPPVEEPEIPVTPLPEVLPDELAYTGPAEQSGLTGLAATLLALGIALRLRARRL